MTAISNKGEQTAPEYFFAWFDAPPKDRDDGRRVVYHVKEYDGGLFCGADKRTNKLIHCASEPLEVQYIDAGVNTGWTCGACIKILKKKLFNLK